MEHPITTKSKTEQEHLHGKLNFSLSMALCFRFLSLSLCCLKFSEEQNNVRCFLPMRRPFLIYFQILLKRSMQYNVYILDEIAMHCVFVRSVLTHFRQCPKHVWCKMTKKKHIPFLLTDQLSCFCVDLYTFYRE